MPVVRRPAALPPVLLLAVLAVVGAAPAGGGEPPKDAPAPVAYAPGRELCRLADPALRESSGLAASRRNPGVFWTHNDSGALPRLHAFNAKGQDLGTYPVAAGALDWEDMAAATVGGRHYLVVADTGDNFRLRPWATLLWMEEPAVPAAPAADGKPAGPPAIPARALHFVFEGGPADCESVAVDQSDGTIYLVSKPGRGARASTVYSLPGPFPPAGAAGGGAVPPEPPAGATGEKALVARKVAEVQIADPTAMDISPDGRRALIVNLRGGFEFARRAGEAWKEAFAREPRTIRLPDRPQGEAACYGPDGLTIYLTSETRKPGELCPFYIVPPAK